MTRAEQSYLWSWSLNRHKAQTPVSTLFWQLGLTWHAFIGMLFLSGTGLRWRSIMKTCTQPGLLAARYNQNVSLVEPVSNVLACCGWRFSWVPGATHTLLLALYDNCQLSGASLTMFSFLGLDWRAILDFNDVCSTVWCVTVDVVWTWPFVDDYSLFP